MIKELLRKQQPIVYQALKNACENQRISSAYLFTGPYGTPKYEAAILLAQSIFCQEADGLACETCNTCRRVREGLYTDLVVLDGRDKAVSKDMVDDLQAQFAHTAAEESGQRVYIIRNGENASAAAQNSMLKFLEEPGEGVTAIITTDAVNRLLPTIISRCTQIPFLPLDETEYYNQAVTAGIPEEDAYFISHLVKDPDDFSAYFDEESGQMKPVYVHAVSMLKQVLNLEGLRREELSVDYEYSWSSKEKDSTKAKKENLLLLNTFFELVILYCEDVLKHDFRADSWYDNAVKKADKKPEFYAELLKIAAEQKDLCNKYNDINLLLYQTIFRLEELYELNK